MVDMTDYIRNDSGKVAMMWNLPHRQAPNLVKVDGTDRTYSPVYQWNIAMIFAEEQDVDRLLKVRQKICNCNNGTYKNAFVLPSQLNYNLWLSGNREGVVA